VDSDSLLKIATLLEIETAGHKRRKRDGPRLLAEQENTTKPLHKLNADVMKKLKLGTKGRIAEKWRVLVNYVSKLSDADLRAGFDEKCIKQHVVTLVPRTGESQEMV